MTPEAVLRPLLKKYALPDSVVRLLYLLLQREIEKGYPSLENPPDPGLRYAQGLDHIFSKLPPIFDLDDRKLFATLSQLAGITDADISYLYSFRREVEKETYLHTKQSITRRIENVHDILAAHSEVKGAGKVAKPVIDRLNRELRELKEPTVQPYLTYFWHTLLNFNVSFDLPHRNEHTHIIAAPGGGKTELIKKLAAADIRSDAAVIVMAPKGDLIATLARLPSDRTIWVSDWSQVGLNLFDLDTSLLIYVFASLLEAEPTPKQQALLSIALKSVHSLDELRDFLKKPPEKTYAETAEQLNWRIDLLLSNPLIGQIFSRETNISVSEVMEQGKVLLLDTSIKTLGDTGSSFIGRYFIALIAKATHQKTAKRPCYVYIDECATYLTEYVEDLLDRAREANVGLILAHQHLAQLSPRLKQSIHNTALKFVGRVNYDDASEMAKQMRISAENVHNLPRLTFYLSGVSRPFTIKIKPGEINKLATSHREHFISSHSMPDKPTVDNTESYDPKEW